MNINQIISMYLLFSLIRCVYTICVGFLYVHRPLKQSSNYSPFVSIVVPAWNESVGLGKTIESIINSNYKNLEVIIVNDGSTDNTNEVALGYTQNFSNVRLIDKENGGKSSALNLGIKNSYGEIIITIDADSYIYPDAISYLISSLENQEIDGAIGKIVVGNRNNFIGVIQYFEYLFGFHSKKSQEILNSIYILPGALTALRKNAIESVGYFEDYSKTEDFDISIKLKSEGHKITYVDDAICITEGASDFKGLLNQRTRWRHGFLQCIIHRKEFLVQTKKGYYLTFVELPFALLGIIDILLYPLLLGFIIFSILTISSSAIFVLSYLVLPYSYLLLMDKDLLKNLRLLKYFALIPILFSIVNAIEFVALIKSLYRIVTKKQTNWTNWVRTGIDLKPER